MKKIVFYIPSLILSILELANIWITAFMGRVDGISAFGLSMKSQFIIMGISAITAIIGFVFDHLERKAFIESL